MPTIRQVAETAGVSIATASRALNGDALVLEETRARVIEAAEELSYRPNIMARNIRRSSSGKGALTYTVGMVMFRTPVFATDPFFSELLASVEGSLRQRGFAVRIISCSADGAVPPEVERREVDGVIVRGTGPVVAKISAIMPTVTLDSYSAESGAYGVVPDYRGGVYEAVKKLIATGHERIALLTGEPGKEVVSYSEMCREGAVKAYEEGKVPVKNLITGGIVGTPAQGYKAGYEILKDRRERPDAIIASDGGMIGIYKAIYEWKMKIPENISCVGTDGVLYGEYLTPALTTVDVHIEELGAKATRALTDILLSGERKTAVEITPVTLVIRNSAKI